MRNTMTNAQALEMAIQLAIETDMEELANKLKHMHEQATKKRNAPKTMTKAQRQTLAQVETVRDIMVRDSIESVDTKWIMAHVDYVTSAQKATAIMRKGVAMGWFVKGEPNHGRVTYKLAE